MNQIDRLRYQKYARVRARKAGLSIVFHSGGVQPHTDGHNLHVSEPLTDWTNEEWDAWYYELMHEIGHEREPWREWKEVMKEKKISRSNILGPLNNLNSDHAQEHGAYGVYKGVDIKLGEGRKKFILKNTTMPEPSNEQEAAWQACWKYDTYKRGNWNPCIAGVEDRIEIHPDAEEYYDKLLAWGRSAADCNNEWEVYDYTLDMLTALGLDAEALEKESQEQYEMQGGKSGGEGDEEGEEAGASNTHYYDPFFEHDHNEETYTQHDTHIDYSQHTRSYDSLVVRDPAVYDFKRALFPTTLDPSRELRGGVASSGFANRVRKLLQVMSVDRWEGGKRKGRVHPRSLWKARVGDDHLFRTKVENLSLKDTAVTLLVDFSGSMAGDKIEHAANACVMLNHAITSLGVSVNVLGFTDGNVKGVSCPIEYRIQQFGERLSSDQIIERMNRCCSKMEQNSDGESLLHAHHSLLQRPEKKKVLVVLSDGSPASTQMGDDDGFLAKVVGEIEKQGVVRLYGIGIQDRNVERYYRNRCVISRAEELEDKLLEVVKNQVVQS